MIHSYWLWIAFLFFILFMLGLDLFAFNKNPHQISIKESLTWTLVWVLLSVLFGIGLFYFMGHEKGIDFFTGYLIEKSLSIDNIFVFLLIFRYFHIPDKYQHEVLFWGILGALVMRFLFILTGIALIDKFDWVIYIFGGFLIFTGIKMLREKNKEMHPDKNPAILLLRRFLPVSTRLQGDKFLIRKKGLVVATPLLVTLLVVETTDILFAMDSIPAILGITRDTFIVFSSNVFAILGLRALYFSLAGIMKLFHHLHFGLSGILIFVGLKMIGENYIHISTEVSLGVIIVLLAVSIIASMIFPEEVKA